MKSRQLAVIVTTTIFMVLICASPGFLSVNTVNQSLSDAYSNESFEGYIDLTVHEVWNLVNDTSNGIQYLIDVRYDPEWTAEHIDAPYPEYARHHCKCEWADETVLQDFMDTYDGEEIILYCKSGGRSVSAAETLIDHGFNGTIYNMVGGITYWKNNEYPTVPNRPPAVPQIQGLTKGLPSQPYNFTCSTTDLDYDKVYYYVKWGDGESDIYSKAFSSDEDAIFSHSWDEVGRYTIEVKARDHYFEESAWTSITFDVAFTELEITSVQSGFGFFSFTLKNKGDYTAEGISSTIYINGGLFSNRAVNYSIEDSLSNLQSGDRKTITSQDACFIVGIGPIDIDISVAAANAETIYLSKSGFILGPFLIL